MPHSPPQMEEDSFHPSSCETPPTPAPQQDSNFDSLTVRSGDDFQDNGTGPRNLWTKRIMAIWRNRSDDYGPSSAMHPSKRKWKNKVNHKASCDSDKAIQNPTRMKRKRERIIEDSCKNPHTYRAPQCRTFH